MTVYLPDVEDRNAVTINGKEKYPCFECGRSFFQIKSLQLHMKRHQNGWTNPYPEKEIEA